VDLEKRRVVQLLAERSVETSQAWLRRHPEIDLVSRDRGKIFRDAATQGAPQAKQVVDRFHLQKNFAEALEKFFRKQEHALKTATQSSAGKTRSAARTKMPEKIAQERRARHRQRVSVHKQIWKLYRQGCHNVAQLYEEIVAASDTQGRSVRFRCGFAPFVRKRARPVSKQTIILDKPPSPRGVALMMVRSAHSRTREQTAYLQQLVQREETIAVVFTLAQDFGRRLAQARGAGTLRAMENRCPGHWDCGTDRFCRRAGR
jgi:transposase